MNTSEYFNLNDDMKDILLHAPSIIIPESREHILRLATNDQPHFSVVYNIEGKGMVEEVTVAKCKNGLAVNYKEPHMRRRDPECMYIADNLETDKAKYKDKFGDFDEVRKETFKWLKQQDLIVMPFISGDQNHGGYESILIAPKNAAFFVGGLADLQGFIPKNEIRKGFSPKAVIYLAPTFRHTHFNGEQVVVHNRLPELHEVFSFNLYPGPSAKKGIYGVLLSIGEKENWLTAHASSVKVVTPSNKSIIIMHEGASGGGKSEMIEEMHREPNGQILLAEDKTSNKKLFMKLRDTCELYPVTDDMALCHPSYQNDNKLVISDAEAGWFLRFNHITEYGTSPMHEKLTTHPPEPLIFLNMQGVSGSRILIWDHTLDDVDTPCPNPRVIMPRHFIKNIIAEPVNVDVRSFGVRMPLCSRENPTYGIAGMLHILPPALAWLWRLVSPRGHANPSILDTEGMSSEGVGSYWPFATGKMVTQANLLLDQIVNTPETKYTLMPNQHIGSYEVGFTAEWINRECLARKGGAHFDNEQLTKARCTTLGYALSNLHVEGFDIPKELLQTNHQSSIGNEAYDKGAQILVNFFKKELQQFLVDDLKPLGRRIINAYMNDASLEELEAII